MLLLPSRAGRGAALVCALFAAVGLVSAPAQARIIRLDATAEPTVLGAADGRLPNLPLQFTGNLTVVAHLVDRVRRRVMGEGGGGGGVGELTHH
jgi:hypothetical protein